MPVTERSAVPMIRFGEFELDIPDARLRRSGTVVDLPPKSFELLVCLVRRPQTLVPKDDLLDIVWGRRFVSEGAIKTVVSELRAALGDDAKAPRWIETVPRRGYRFIGDVIAEQAPTPAAASAAEPVPGPLSKAAAGLASPAPDGNLPPPGPALFGRDDDIAALCEQVDSTPLLTLTGPGGVGKTRLALAVARARQGRHAGGVWWLPLAPLAPATTDSGILRSALARALRIAPLGTGSDAELVRAIGGQPLLLVLDNAEHLLDVLAPWLADWAPHLPGLRLLITSREPLQLPGEQVWRVAPLPVPAGGEDSTAADMAGNPALRLLVTRIGARLQGFTPGPAQQQALAKICRSLDGLPLALELGAARVPVLGVHGLAEQLEDDAAGHRLQLLTQGARTALPHQRTLRATLDWSHALLTPTEQRVLRRLAVFRGGFTAATARAVATAPGEDPWTTLDALATLGDKSMLVAAAPDAPDARIGMLESVREYALEQLESSGEADATAQRHLLAMVALFTEAEAEALDVPQLPWLAPLEPELENLRSALRWAEAHADDPTVTDARLDLVAASARYFQRMALSAEGARFCLAVRASAETHRDPLRRAGIDLAVGTLCRFTPMLTAEEHLALARRAVQTFEDHGDTPRAHYAHYLAWALALEVGEHVARAHHVDRMYELVQPSWGPMRTRLMRSAWAQDQRLLGHADTFLQACREDLALLRDLEAQAESWIAAHTLMLAEHDLGEVDRALAIGQSAIDEIRAAGRLRGQTQLLVMHTAMRADAGDVAGTRAALADAVPTLGTMQITELLWLAMAWLAWHEGRGADAARLLGWFDSPVRGCGAYGPRTFTRRSIARLSALLDTALGAREHEDLQATGAALGQAEALRVGMRTSDGDRRRAPRPGTPPQTDANPTAS